MRHLIALVFLIIAAPSWSEDPSNPEVEYPIEIIGRSWIDASDIRENFIPPLTLHERSNYTISMVIPLSGADPSVSLDTGGIAKDSKYRLWSKVLLKAKVKNNALTVTLVTDDVDGGYEMLWAVKGTSNLTKPIPLTKVGEKYTLDYQCWGQPDSVPEAFFQGIRVRTSTNIWHRISGEIYLENGALKHDIKFFGASQFPTHDLYVNSILISRLKQGFISDLWIPDPANPAFVIRRP